MSHKWTTNAYGILSDRAMADAQKDVLTKPFFLSHDNVNIPMRVFLQRLHNQSHFVSGCAATAWILPEEARLSEGACRAFQHHRAEGMNIQFDYGEVMLGDETVDRQIKAQFTYHILSVLLNCPDFKDYQHRENEILKPPPAVEELPCGSEYTCKQYMLRTTDIEEASYEGTDKNITEWYKQLKLDSTAEKKKTAWQRLLAFIGDQLTVQRVRGLWKF